RGAGLARERHRHARSGLAAARFTGALLHRSDAGVSRPARRPLERFPRCAPTVGGAGGPRARLPVRFWVALWRRVGIFESRHTGVGHLRRGFGGLGLPPYGLSRFSTPLINRSSWPATCFPASSTSTCDSFCADKPAATLVMLENPRHRSPRARAAITSGTVDIPTASAPIR